MLKIGFYQLLDIEFWRLMAKYRKADMSGIRLQEWSLFIVNFEIKYCVIL